MKKNNTKVYYTPIQLKLPVDFEKIIEIDDPVYSFNEVMVHIDLQKYFVYYTTFSGEIKGHNFKQLI